jgi:tetraacyldisaccharide 4'-kinase
VIEPEPTFEQKLVKAWHAKVSWLWLLLPLSLLFRFIVFIRRIVLQTFFQGGAFAVPVIVVGNISVGGSGKTPLIIALAAALTNRGFTVAIVSRGYGGQAPSYPLEVEADTAVEHCGDEPLLIRQKLANRDCYVVVDPDRNRAVNFVLQQYNCDLVLCDDGMQHYRLYRDAEIAVVDGSRGFGNGFCLPVGPLREPISRLASTTFVAVNGDCDFDDNVAPDINYCLQPVCFRQLATGQMVPIAEWALSNTVHAVAAIGNPQRFANTLKSLGFEVILLRFDDHEVMTESDLTFEDNYPVIITAKDAVKFTKTDLDHVWVLEVDVTLPEPFVNDVLSSVGLPQTQSF